MVSAPSLLSPQEIESRARDRGMTLAELCRRAQIAPSTFQRWKGGETEPTLTVYRRLVEAVAPAAEDA